MTAQTQPIAPSTRRGRNTALWVLQGLTAAIFLFAAVGKFIGVARTPVGRGRGPGARRLMTGATITHLVVGSGVALPLPVLLLTAVIAWGRRDSSPRLWASIGA